MVASGCASTDPETVYVLNRRISDLEGGSPRIQQQAQVQSDGSGIHWRRDALNYVYLYVPLDNGSFYPVRIDQVAANAFRGPNGEVYYSFPTVEQLKRLYPPR